MGGAGHITVAAPKGIKMDIARKVEAADAYIDLDRANADEQWAQIKKDNPCKLDLWCMSTSQTNPQTVSTLSSSALVLRRSQTTLSTTSPEVGLSSFTVFTPTTPVSLGHPPRSSLTRSSEWNTTALLRTTLTIQHHWFFLPDLLFPTRHRSP